MGRRWVSTMIGLSSVAAMLIAAPGGTSAGDPLPSVVVALGDSLTSGWGSGVSNGANVPGDNFASSWATGSDPVVDSHLLRLQQAGATISASSVTNLAVPGVKVTQPGGIVDQAGNVPTGAGLILIELGSADLCADTNMTPVDQFRSRIDQALTTITQRAPNAKIQIASIPNWHQVWVDFPNEPRTSTCPLLFDPTVADDAAVQQRTIDYNTELAAACAAFPACKFDGGAVYDLHFSLDDLSTVDHFHPSRSGQAKIAAATFDSGWFASDAAPAARQFGYTTPGSSSGAPGEGVKFGTISTLSDDAAISDFGFYVTGSSTQQSFVPAIYSVDASGNPDALLVTGDPIVVPAGAPAEWVRGPLPATTLAAGQYMLALLAGPTAGGASIAFDAVSGAGFFNANPYPTPSDPWGSLNPVDQKLSLFVDYTLADTAPPVITVPSAITQEATGPTGAIVNYSVTATDAVDGAEPVSCDHVSGAAFTLGDTTVVCTASDAAGNTASASFGVTVRDTTPPTLTGVPTDQTMQASSAAGAPVTFATPTAQDVVDGTRAVTCAPSSGSTFPVGTTTVTCTAADTRGNTATRSFAVTVLAPVAASPGGGGGGGGGGGSGPSFKVSISGASAGLSVGSTVGLSVAISNPGSNADSATLHLSLSGLQFVSAQVDRGSGCNADGGSVTCFLDFFNSGLSATELINVRITSLPASVTASLTSAPTGTSETGSWSASSTTPVATAPFLPAPIAPAKRTSLGAALVVSNVAALTPVRVSTAHPAVLLTLTLSKAVRLTFTLIDTKGHVLATWTQTAKAGKVKLKLPLPKKARKAGRDTIRVSTSGSGAKLLKKLPIVLRR